MYPSIWVSSTRKRRHEEIKLQMPFVIDLLTLSTEAGLDFIGALQKVVEKTRPGPLVGEIERMLQEIQLGTTRADAMRDMAWRIDLTEISSLVAVLVTADQMGSSLGGVLRVQSELIRTQRFTNAEKKGAAASQKLLFPLIFFIMPAVFIMIFGPVARASGLPGGQVMTALKKESRVLISRCRVATGFFERFMGLMLRSGIGEDEAILFPRCNSIHMFFMRFPIDVVLVAEDGEVVEVIECLRPWRLILPRSRARHVIEMKSGRSRQLGISAGEKLTCPGVWV
jgi:uncharacterized membrane protein (UPF0127 family)